MADVARNYADVCWADAGRRVRGRAIARVVIGRVSAGMRSARVTHRFRPSVAWCVRQKAGAAGQSNGAGAMRFARNLVSEKTTGRRLGALRLGSRGSWEGEGGGPMGNTHTARAGAHAPEGITSVRACALHHRSASARRACAEDRACGPRRRGVRRAEAYARRSAGAERETSRVSRVGAAGCGADDGRAWKWGWA